MTYPTYRCYNCGTMISAQPCFQCENMKNLRRAADAQEEANRRAERESRDRERERERSRYEAEREAYYERQRRREADPEYQAQKAFEREQERKQELARQRQIEEARLREQERWNSLTPVEQAAEIELKNKRQQLADAKMQFEREKHRYEEQKRSNFKFGLKSVLWVTYAGFLLWVFTSLIPGMFKALTLLAFPLGAIVLILSAMPGIYLMMWDEK